MKYRVVRRKDGSYRLQFELFYPKPHWANSSDYPKEYQDPKEALAVRNKANGKYQ